MEDAVAYCYNGYANGSYERLYDYCNYTKLDLEDTIMLRLYEMILVQGLNSVAFFGIISNALFLFKGIKRLI